MKWFLGVLVLLVAALFLDSGLLAYATYVLIGLLVLSRWLARSWIGGLSATRTCSLVTRGNGRIPAPDEPPDPEGHPRGLTADVGERVVVRLTVHNKGWLPVPWVLLEDVLPNRVLDKRFPRLKIKGKRLHIGMVRPGGTTEMKYQVEFLARGYYQLGPLVLEGGDLFGLHRRYRVETLPTFVLVYPRIVGLVGYELASRRPIGDVRMTHRLFEDPTRIAGVRPYEAGDPLSRVHWKATARTGQLHSKIHEPSTLSGATVILDFHQAGYHTRGEPFRSELAVMGAISLANAVYEMGQQVGLVTNARDAADRIKTQGWQVDPRTRQAARSAAGMGETSERLQPLVVPTRRGVEQLQRMRETLARAELTDGMTFAELVVECAHRIPRDATVIAVLPDVTVESAIALGNLRRRGLAVTAMLVMMDDDGMERAYGRLVAEGIRDLRHLANEEALPELCRNHVQRATPYDFAGLGL